MKVQGAEVAIVYRFLPEWRVEFFCGLRKVLESQGTRLRLYYGKNSHKASKTVPANRLKWGNEVDLDWAIPITNRVWSIMGYECVWQEIPFDIYNADLIILMQENRILSNYVVSTKQAVCGKKVAFWGHGFNHQGHPLSLGNRLKHLSSTHVDWWFAYTAEVAQKLEGNGFPPERITVVNNAIDTIGLRSRGQATAKSDLLALRLSLGLGDGPVGLYCGDMYPDKNLGFLVEACDAIRALVAGFEMIFVGGGSEVETVRRFAEARPWVHYVGPRYGTSRIPYFLLSDVCLLPGAVGLAVLDCFALATPLITRKNPRHGPEIEYLSNGLDGIMSGSSLDEYVSAVVNLLGSDEDLARLKAGCLQKATYYTVENMIDRFASGVQRALAS